MITLTNFNCGYDNTVIENLSLHIASHLCILGPNGAGKSTLAKALCGLVKFSGSYVIDGKTITSKNTKPLRDAITYVPSKLELYDSRLTVFEFILLGRYSFLKRLEGFTSNDHGSVDDALSLLGIETIKHHYVAALSSGQQQLVMIAQALVQESPTMIFDEPTSNLDPHHQKNIITLLQTLMKTKRVILITHDLNIARTFNQAVLFIDKMGCDVYNDAHAFFLPDVLKHHYNTSFIVNESYVGVDYA